MTKKDPWNSKTALVVGILALVILFSSFYIMNQPSVTKEKATPVTQGVVSINIVRPSQPSVVTGELVVNILPRSEVK